MKKILGVLVSSQISLMAGIADLKQLYVDKRYAEVVVQAKKSTSLYGDARLHMLWGKSAEALGDDEMAMSAYERVLMIDPDNVAVRVHLASLYAYMERDELAKEMSISTQNYQLTPAQRNSLDVLRKANAQDIKIAAKFAIGYDSNVNVSPTDLDIISGTKPLSTMFAQFSANLSHTYMLNDENSWYVRSDANLFYQNNFDSEASDYNLFAFSAGVGLGYRGDNYDLLVPVKYGRLHYLDRDFMETIGVEPRVNFTLSKSLIATANARFTQRNYLDASDKNRDDEVLGYGGGLYWLFDKNFAYLTSNYDNFDARQSTSLLFTDKETFNFAAGVNYNINEWLVTRLDYRYKYTLYGDFLPAGTKQRNDYYNQAQVKFSHTFLDTMVGSLLYQYSDNRSNYNLAEYDKDMVILGVEYNY